MCSRGDRALIAMMSRPGSAWPRKRMFGSELRLIRSRCVALIDLIVCPPRRTVSRQSSFTCRNERDRREQKQRVPLVGRRSPSRCSRRSSSSRAPVWNLFARGVACPSGAAPPPGTARCRAGRPRARPRRRPRPRRTPRAPSTRRRARLQRMRTGTERRRAGGERTWRSHRSRRRS